MNNPLKLIWHFAQVSWPNIGLAAAGPARPAPTALTSYANTASHPKLPHSFTSITLREFKSSDGENFCRRRWWTTATGKEAPKGNIIGLDDGIRFMAIPLRNIPAATKNTIIDF